MKTLILTLGLGLASTAFAENYCSIINPLTNDAGLRFCPATKYGITFDDRLFDNNCYVSFDEATKWMHKIPACKIPAKIGACKVLFPNISDTAYVLCPKNQFGITYQGHLKSRTSCYPTLQRALEEMKNSEACGQRNKYLDFAILSPNTNDRLYQACPTYSFGVSYKGVLIDNKCYDSVEKALSAFGTAIDRFL